jgi:hypothetical protein
MQPMISRVRRPQDAPYIHDRNVVYRSIVVPIDLTSQPGDAVAHVGAHGNPAPNRDRVESRHAGIIS